MFKVGNRWVDAKTMRKIRDERLKAERQEKENTEIEEKDLNVEEVVKVEEVKEKDSTEEAKDVKEQSEEFRCQLCDFVGKNRAGLMAHIRAKHPEVYKVEK